MQHWLTHHFRSTAIRDNPEDKTKYTLIYTNKSEKDILLREEFDKLAKQNPPSRPGRTRRVSRFPTC